jgi:predicted MarR family transcription regulator
MTPPGTSGESALDLAAKRLDRAVMALEQRLAERLRTAGAEAGGLFDQDRAHLADELDRSRAREKELETAGAEASAALGRAIAEIRAAVGETQASGDA